MLKTILLSSPVVVYFWNYKTFMSYKSGVFSCPRAPTDTELNHGVLIIGYDKNGDYLVKNSWGTTWGTYGFGTVSKSADCGIKRQLAQFTNGNTVNAMASQNCSMYDTNFDTNGYTFEPNLVVKMLLLVILLTLI